MQDKFDEMSNNLVGKIDDMGYNISKIRHSNRWYRKELKWYDEWNWCRRWRVFKWWRKKMNIYLIRNQFIKVYKTGSE